MLGHACFVHCYKIGQVAQALTEVTIEMNTKLRNIKSRNRFFFISVQGRDCCRSTQCPFHPYSKTI
jgi:hypothetical protein